MLYATVYGSHVLYALIGSGSAFAGMAVVTAAALGLSLRHGVPTAVMGLVGGFLTPLLVGEPQRERGAPAHLSRPARPRPVRAGLAARLDLAGGRGDRAELLLDASI